MVLFIIILIGVALYAARDYLPINLSEAASLTDPGKEELENTIKDVIQNNPEMIVNAFKAAQEKSSAEAASKSKLALASKKQEIESVLSSPYSGNPKGDVTIVEFFDYRCGYCKTVNKTVQELLVQDKNIKILYKELPILGEASLMASKAALAVYHIDNSKYFDYHNQLMQIQNVDKEAIEKVAVNVGISVDTLKAAMEKPLIKEELDRIQNLAQQVGISGTPAFVIDGELIPGAIDLASFKAKIEEVRKKKK
jgi:protein-disulfide isomerase